MSMTPNWKIKYYKTPSGAELIYSFINSLPQKAKTKIYNTFELLTEFGVRLRLPHAKKITGTPIWELRILGQDSIRILYIALPNQTFLLLHGFVKKKQKTSLQDINIALRRLREQTTRP